jgi:hypothetical protein
MIYSTQCLHNRVRGCFRRGLCCHDFMKTDLRIANNHCFASAFESSARFWTATALCRFSTAGRATQSGRGLSQSKTLTHGSLIPCQLSGYSIF